MASFSDKVVLVTGAAAGIGRAAAMRFAEEGAQVCVADLNGSGAEAVAAMVRDRGGDAFGISVDVSREDDNARMVDETLTRFGGLDAAFLNAGFYGQPKPFFDHDLADFDRLIAINLRGAFMGIHATGRAIRADGAIVVTASTAGLLGLATAPGYTAAKHGVIGLVRAAAGPLAERRVRINAICPGAVATAMILDEGEARLSVPADELPMPAFRGMGHAQHVAELALFLASRRAAYLTGSVQVADAGLTSSFAG
jgi:NAD(P)-dependent dehydrogenase (short-subunit alcohol dehydrogenase family)